MLPTERPSITLPAILGGWMEERIAVAGHAFDVLRPSQPDEFLERLEDLDRAEAEQDPYWAELWPTSSRMAAFVLGETWQRGTRALELGCGVGLVGLAGLKAGLDITFSDLHDLAVRTAVENAERNGFSSVPGRVLDWRQPDSGNWPLIFASDVLYERQLHQPLLSTLDACLSADGVCWLGDPVRSAADSFVEAATTRGYSVKILDANGRQTSDEDDRFRLLRLIRDVLPAKQDSNLAIE
ncbi:MAG: hypothetical protein CMJ64_09470 [Planctomycetaceae bacterium]|nr:hypothetical protein [Planctomycetaceae bacterium]